VIARKPGTTDRKGKRLEQGLYFASGLVCQHFVGSLRYYKSPNFRSCVPPSSAVTFTGSKTIPWSSGYGFHMSQRRVIAGLEEKTGRGREFVSEVSASTIMSRPGKKHVRHAAGSRVPRRAPRSATRLGYVLDILGSKHFVNFQPPFRAFFSSCRNAISVWPRPVLAQPASVASVARVRRIEEVILGAAS